MPENRWAEFPKFKRREKMAYTNYWGRSLISIPVYLPEYINDKNFRFGSILQPSPNTRISSIISKIYPLSILKKMTTNEIYFQVCEVIRAL